MLLFTNDPDMKLVVSLIITTLFLLCQFGQAQIKELKPSIVHPLNLSDESAKLYNGTYQKIWDDVKYDDLSAAEKKAIENGDETKGYWETVGSACSWYCGGGPKEVKSSSYLTSQGANSYAPKNAHDFSYKNAWVEGVAGYGIGEYLEYSFTGVSPRITTIIVVNGYVKSESAYRNNSRVKKLKVYVNDKPYAIFNLRDLRSAQYFEVDTLGTSDRDDWKAMEALPDWKLKFEILEVYKGNKYDDTVISEIYFDGLDVHCFAAGTKVLMADMTAKNVEDIKIGEEIATWDIKTNTTQTATIEKLESVKHHSLVTYVFASGMKITVTQDHPFLVINKGWASLKPEKSKQYKSFESIAKIMIDDVFMTINEYDKLVDIIYEKGNQDTYTISKLSTGDNFIANGFVVGIEVIK